ncbi:hypothetical protein SSX86_017075 [Deinandra increscens subsp. villosa]|uniref:Uncharacterized protein n=1 Tax=Deinandra increscens subsp. villosa TaxID=3103831 RepID=A0AAP0CUE0_9ASTR
MIDKHPMLPVELASTSAEVAMAVVVREENSPVFLYPEFTKNRAPNLLNHFPLLGRFDETKMGGGGEHHGDHGHAGGDFRTKVWTMTGGPNCRPLHWKRNTAIAMAGIFLVCIPIAMKSAELEQRPHMPVRPVPSQIWCKNFGNKEY